VTDKKPTPDAKSALDMTLPEFATALRNLEREDVRRRRDAATGRYVASLAARFPKAG
jgi:hypothetical protein